MDKIISYLDRLPRLPNPDSALGDFWSDTRGVTAIEYALLAGLIAVVCVGSISATGTSVDRLYAEWAQAVLQAL